MPSLITTAFRKCGIYMYPLDHKAVKAWTSFLNPVTPLAPQDSPCLQPSFPRLDKTPVAKHLVVQAIQPYLRSARLDWESLGEDEECILEMFIEQISEISVAKDILVASDGSDSAKPQDVCPLHPP